MYKEILPTADRLELDRALRSEWPTDQPLRDEDRWINVCRSLGQVALEATFPRTNSDAIYRPYWRGNGRLSGSDVRELEGYFEFLRLQYGIPEGATVFPKRDAETVAPTGRRMTMRPDIINRLRNVMPERPVGFHEALRLAEHQASLLLELTVTTHPAVPERIITALPRIEVRRLAPFPTSGAAHWWKGKWQVAINATEPATRQRFSLAHELKHIVDHRDANLLYAALPPRERDQMIERVCDYFAGCLLMPRAWIMAAHASGNRHPTDLAQVFGVSPTAIGVRLNQIGLTRPGPRCGSNRHDGTVVSTWSMQQAGPRETPASSTSARTSTSAASTWSGGPATSSAS